MGLWTLLVFVVYDTLIFIFRYMFNENSTMYTMKLVWLEARDFPSIYIAESHISHLLCRVLFIQTSLFNGKYKFS